MVKYVLNETQDENEPDAVEQLVQILTTDLPEDKEIIMTFAQQLEQKGRYEGFEKGVNSVKRIMQSKGFDESTIEEILKLSKEELEQEKV